MSLSDETSAAPDVAALVASAAADHPERLAVVEAGGRGLTWAELEDEVGRVATGLGRAGVLAGHRVLLALGNRLEFVTSYLGVLRAQAVAVPVNPGSTPTELAAMLVDCGARLVVADGQTVDAVRSGAARPEVTAPPVTSTARPRASCWSVPTPSTVRARTTTSAPSRPCRCRRCRIPRSSPSCSTRAARRGARARRCSPTAPCWRTSTRSPPYARR